MRKFNFILQALFLVIGTFLFLPATHWKAPLFFGVFFIVIVLIVKKMGYYRYRLFLYLHLFFATILIVYTGFVSITNKLAYETGVGKYKELQAQVCEGRTLDMTGWIPQDKPISPIYKLEFRRCGLPYKIKVLVQDDRKNFKIGVYQGYYQVGGPYIEGGPLKCRNAQPSTTAVKPVAP